MNAQPNDRIRLDYTNDEYTHLRPGAEGTVTSVRLGPDFPQVHVRWDDGSNLSLLPGVDRYTVIGHSNVVAQDRPSAGSVVVPAEGSARS